MTDTTAFIAAGSKPTSAAGLLLDLIVTLLAPMFLGVAGGDIALARRGALETVNAYCARSHSDLIAVAQIVAFGLAALGSLCLSMDDDISVNMALRLRGNANALNRSAEQNRRALAQSQSQSQSRPAAPEARPGPAEPAGDELTAAELLVSLAAAREYAAEAESRHQEGPPATEADKRRHQEMWAIAMVKEASEITARLATLPPSERQHAELQAAVLSRTAHDMLYGGMEPPPIPNLFPDPAGNLPLP